jgi:hypothetical protein
LFYSPPKGLVNISGNLTSSMTRQMIKTNGPSLKRSTKTLQVCQELWSLEL